MNRESWRVQESSRERHEEQHKKRARKTGNTRNINAQLTTKKVREILFGVLNRSEELSQLVAEEHGCATNVVLLNRMTIVVDGALRFFRLHGVKDSCETHKGILVRTHYQVATRSHHRTHSLRIHAGASLCARTQQLRITQSHKHATRTKRRMPSNASFTLA
jgi:hypothetical protein